MPKSTFTTYLNVAEDRSSEAAFDRLAQTAVGAYGVITRAADEASRATAGLIAGRGSAGLGTAINSNLRQRATEMRNLGAASERVGVQSDRTARAIKTEGLEAERAAIRHGRLTESLRSTAVGLQVVQGPLGPLAGSRHCRRQCPRDNDRVPAGHRRLGSILSLASPASVTNIPHCNLS